jgi:uncharacterized protein YggE
LSKYERLITKLLEAGVNRVDSVEFLVAEPRKYKDEARAKAIRAAREKALAMAGELGQTIGKPWDISEEGFNGLFAQTNRSLYANNYVQASSYANDGSPSEQSTVAPGEVSIRASVRVSFQLE